MKNGEMGNIRKGLDCLEFDECIVDSPEFRENLNRHEKELDHTSQQIKRIIKEVNDLTSAAKVSSQRQRTLAKSLKDFNFECIGTAQSDDEQVITDSLRHFGNLIDNIEEEREKMLQLAHDQIIEPLEDFRKKQIGGVKENKKKLNKKTEKFCQSQERFLNMSTKKPENTIQEADASLGMHEREYINESLSYVLRIQEVQERIKFEFVEILLAFIQGWLVFYHTAHDHGDDNKEYLTDLRHKVQKTRENFEEATEKVNELKSKYMEKNTKPEEKFTKRGYLFLMKKKPFKATWTKYYCTYKKQQKEFTMLQFNQISGRAESTVENLTLLSCQCRASEFVKRFCFDLVFKEKPGIFYTFQALREEDRKTWLNAMDGTEPTYLTPGKSEGTDEYQLDENGFTFVRKCIEVLEKRGLEDEGLYRKSGVGTKITKLLVMGLDKNKIESVFNDETYRDLMESNTIASALKRYLKNLNDSLMTYRFHNGFIIAAKQDSLRQRVYDVHTLVHRLPRVNFEMLDLVIKHLKEVSRKHERNKMSVFNLGVVFGPTLLRPQEETVAAISDIKFNNIVINILIENYDLIFKNALSDSNGARAAQSNSPTRAPRVGGRSSGSRNICSPQQPVYRVVVKSNYTEQPMSSSLQSIPNGIYMNTSPNGSGGNGTSPAQSQNNIKKNTAQVSPQKNHYPMTLSESDISIRRETNYISRSSSHLAGQILSGGCLTTHHAAPTALRNNYLMTTTAHPVKTSYCADRHPSVNNISSSGGNHRNEDSRSIYGQRSLLAHTKHCLGGRDDRMPSTICLNELVCDSLSSNRDKHNLTGSAGGRLVNSFIVGGRNSVDCMAPTPMNSSQIPTLLAGDDVIAVIPDNASSDFVPKKIHRTKNLNQIKKDLQAGTARVRTLHACSGEIVGELSFEPNQIITNVRFSHEPDWLQGTLNGKTGLIPENYVKHLKLYH